MGTEALWGPTAHEGWNQVGESQHLASAGGGCISLLSCSRLWRQKWLDGLFRDFPAFFPAESIGLIVMATESHLDVALWNGEWNMPQFPHLCNRNNSKAYLKVCWQE